MKQECKRISTTIRLDAETSEQVRQIVAMTGGGSTQSDVLRHLIHSALGKTSALTMKEEKDLPAETKEKLFEIENALAKIDSTLVRIGNLINVRRKKYNSERKELVDKIESLKKLMKHADSYSRIKHQKQIDELEKKLEEFDSRDTAFVSQEEWNRFTELLKNFRTIGEMIGGDLPW